MMTTVPARGDAAFLPIAMLDADEAQIRTRNGFDTESIKQLAASIQQHGLLQPVLVYPTDSAPGRYRVIAGHRRLAACKMLRMQEVAVSIREARPEPETKAAQAVENLQRMDLALMDKAEGVAELVKQAGAKRAAELLGKSPAWISKHVSLTKLPELLRQLADDGVTADVEILLVLRKLHKLDKAGAVILPLIERIRAGQASRQTVLDALAKFNVGTAAQLVQAIHGEAKEEGDEDKQASLIEKEKFGKLELAEQPARKLLEALHFAQNQKPSSRPGNELIEHVADFIKKTWGAK